MDENSRAFCETTDLYLQLLREAQRIEDKQLARLVLQKLKIHGKCQETASENANVIPLFPAQRLQPECAGSATFWQTPHFWENLIEFLCLLVVCGAWIVLPFFLTSLLALR